MAGRPRKSQTDPALEEQVRERLRQWMRDQGIVHVAELARRSGIQGPQLQRMIEGGKGARGVGMKYLRPLCAALGHQVVDLFTPEGMTAGTFSADDAARATMDRLTHEIARLNNELDRLRPAMERLQPAMDRLRPEIKTLEEDLARVAVAGFVTGAEPPDE